MVRKQFSLVGVGITFVFMLIFAAFRAGRYTAMSEYIRLEMDRSNGSCLPCDVQGRPGEGTDSALAEPGKPARRLLIQSGGVFHDGIGSTITFLKEAVSAAHVLGMDVAFSQSPTNRDYKVTSLLHSDTLNSLRLCDLHTLMLKDPWFGPFPERVDRAFAQLDEFRDQVATHCEHGSDLPIALAPHVQERLEQCDIVIWADQRVRSVLGWNSCTRPWLHRTLGMGTGDGTYKPKSVGVHYRWGDIWWVEEEKWSLDKGKVERILRNIKKCDPTWEVDIYMEASSRPEETEQTRLNELKPIKSYDRIVDTGDGLRDLITLASHEILILNSGTYSETAAAASKAKIVIWNGVFPVYEYLRRTDTRLYTLEEAATLHWCRVLREIGEHKGAQ